MFDSIVDTVCVLVLDTVQLLEPNLSGLETYHFLVFLLEVFDLSPSARFLRAMIRGIRDTCVRLTT